MSLATNVLLPDRESEVSGASARSIRALFEPKSVALLGASRKPMTISGTLLRNLRESFKGAIYPVNSAGGEIQGLPAFTTVAAIGRPIDLGIIAVPAAGVFEAVRQCAEAGANSVVVISAGFGEMGPEGQAEQERIRDLVRSSGMRMVGPNCMGILNTDPAVGLNATFAPTAAPPGNVGMLSQSGVAGRRHPGPCARPSHRHLDLRLGRQQGRRLG